MSPLSDRLLDKIVCPQCKGQLVYRSKENSLECHACKLAYRIIDDIPVLLVDEADQLR